jgi:hypothetical protein
MQVNDVSKLIMDRFTTSTKRGCSGMVVCVEVNLGGV